MRWTGDTEVHFMVMGLAWDITLWIPEQEEAKGILQGHRMEQGAIYSDTLESFSAGNHLQRMFIYKSRLVQQNLLFVNGKVTDFFLTSSRLILQQVSCSTSPQRHVKLHCDKQEQENQNKRVDACSISCHNLKA
ncbi:hypothetical protein QQ045_019542 [Rhodiola kirilowii]